MGKLTAVALLCALVAADGRANADGSETTMVITNHGTRPGRVQVALGSVLPCDSPDNHMMLDATIGPGEARALGLGIAAVACVRNTSPGSTIDWGQSRWVNGGYRCRYRRGCVRDPSVLMRYDIGG